jgi:uncharacterized protein YdeI (YjbR/CyaY-like superfamily)
MSATSIPRELQTALDAYKTNYAAFKVSGDTAHKTAYENALASANQIINQSMTVNQTNDQYIQNFLNDYQKANPEIINLQNESKKIREQGPKLQDELARSKQIHQRAAIEVNESGLYVKAGIVVALLVVVGIVGSL